LLRRGGLWHVDIHWNYIIFALTANLISSMTSTSKFGDDSRGKDAGGAAGQEGNFRNGAGSASSFYVSAKQVLTDIGSILDARMTATVCPLGDAAAAGARWLWDCNAATFWWGISLWFNSIVWFWRTVFTVAFSFLIFARSQSPSLNRLCALFDDLGGGPAQAPAPAAATIAIAKHVDVKRGPLSPAAVKSVLKAVNENENVLLAPNSPTLKDKDKDKAKLGQVVDPWTGGRPVQTRL